jgi:hypothetical protein
MVDVDAYLSRTFDLTRYNCWHFLRDVWMELTGEDLGDRTPERVSAASLIERFDRDVPAFRELPGPTEPSIVLMTRRGAIPHVGAFFGGRILQMTSFGPSYMDPATAAAGFESVRYYR